MSGDLCIVQVSVSAVRSVYTPGNMPVQPVIHDVPRYQPSVLISSSFSSIKMKSPSHISSSSGAPGTCVYSTRRTYQDHETMSFIILRLNITQII